jgi:hypothetical protein
MENKIGTSFEEIPPLPDPKEEEKKFLGSFAHLSQDQIRNILTVIIDQAKESRTFGLDITSALLEKEETFFLRVLDNYGGIGQLVNDNEFDDVSQKIRDLAAESFHEESQQFFEKFKEAKDGGSKIRYNVHLELMRGTLLNLAYNHQLG